MTDQIILKPKTILDCEGAKNLKECVSMFIQEEKTEHTWKNKEQLVAAAYNYCREEKGFKDSYPSAQAAYSEPIMQSFGKTVEMNGVLKVQTIMAREMVQSYHRSEIPWLEDLLPPDVEYIPVLKDYSELKKAADEMKEKWIPWVIPHTHGTFLKEQAPIDCQKYIEPEEVRGKVSGIRGDDEKRAIKADVYMNKAKHDKQYLQDTIDGKIGDVSIGFICDFDFDPGNLNGEEYLFVQRNIHYGHLAGLPGARGKCPSGMCGTNMDQTPVEKQKRLNSALRVICDEVLTVKRAITEFVNTDPQPDFHVPITVNNNDFKKDILPSIPQKVSSMPTLEEVLAENQRLKLELSQAKDSVSATQIKSIQTDLDKTKQENTDWNTKFTTLEGQYRKLKTDFEDQGKKLKDFQDKELTILRDELRPFMGDDVDKRCLHDLTVMKDVKEKLDKIKTNDLTQNGLPKPSEKDHNRTIAPPAANADKDYDNYSPINTDDAKDSVYLGKGSEIPPVKPEAK